MTETSTPADSTQRDRLLARFTGWLDEALGEEAPPSGIAAELLADAGPTVATCDLFSLWSALGTLTQEVKLQGRTFHELAGAVQSLPDEVASLRDANERVLRRERDALEERAFAPVLELLLDLRERLRRGRDEARAHVSRLEALPRPGRLARFFGARVPDAAEAEQAFVRGYELALERLDEALAERGIAEVACAGRAFDPHVMRAVDTGEAPGVAEGTVLEVLRTGYTRQGQLLRAAEVKVARGGKS